MSSSRDLQVPEEREEGVVQQPGARFGDASASPCEWRRH